jgi:hypothetical protein
MIGPREQNVTNKKTKNFRKKDAVLPFAGTAAPRRNKE